MPTFPIPIFVACVLGFVGLRLWQQSGRASLLVFLLMLCAVQSLIIALSQHYGVASMRIVQPLMASLIPPAAWLAYRNQTSRKEAVHALGPLIVLAAMLVSPQFLDVFLPGLFFIYGLFIVVSTKAGTDILPNTLLASADLPARVWASIGIALVASALCDVLIVTSQMAGYTGFRPWIISVFSTGNLLVIGALSSSPHLQNVVDEDIDKASPVQVADTEVWGRLQDFMATKKPFLDPDLTLTQLSRQMGVPMKVLSTTINVTTGGNVSRFINNARISAAQDAMLKGESVTSAFLASGFNTKSNFNREFLRVVGSNPSTWLRAHKQPTRR